MTDRRNQLFAALLFAAPVGVAWFDLSVAAAVGFTLLLLLARWLITLSGILFPEKTPELELATISASHFVEKVRWCMDRLGLEYTERVSAGALGAYFRGRSVPQLKVRSGIVRSVIGDSPDILRYLYGRSLADDPSAAAFLEPTAERVELERRLDRYATSLQVWIYYHLLPDRDLTLRAWGHDNPATPAWQRLLLKPLYPLLAYLIRVSFRISDTGYARAVERIEAMLLDVEGRLADGRKSLLGAEEINFTDIAFAAYTGLWLMPEGYGGGKAEPNRIERSAAPEAMRRDIERWMAAYERAVAFAEDLYDTRKGDMT